MRLATMMAAATTMMNRGSRQSALLSTVIISVIHCVSAFSYAQNPLPAYHNRRPPHNSIYSSSKMARFASSSNSNHPASNNNDVCVRILCLHGKGGNGKQFLNSSMIPLRSLVEKRLAQNNECTNYNLSFQWDALTAPFEMTSPGSRGKRQSDDTGYSWWTMPPGVRSYNAKEYEGFEESEDLVMEKILSNNYDIILGHSQGAILTAAILSIHDSLWKSSGTPLGYILNGSAWPNPYHNSLISLQHRSEIESSPRMLFIMGKEDKINPIESAMQVYDAYQAAKCDVTIVTHNGGHSVPLGRDEDSVRALEEVVDWIISIANEKALGLGKEL